LTDIPASPISGEGERIWRSIPDNPPKVSPPSLKLTKPKDIATENDPWAHTALSFDSVLCDHYKYILHTGGDERKRKKKREEDRKR